jgi:hypothetical protein
LGFWGNLTEEQVAEFTEQLDKMDAGPKKMRKEQARQEEERKSP